MAEAGLGDDLLLANEVVDASPARRACARRAAGSPWPSTPRRPSTRRPEPASRGADRRERRAAPLRMPSRGRRPAGRPGPGRRSLRARSHGIRGTHRRPGGPGHPGANARGLHGPAARGHDRVGGEVISAGGTGTYDINALGHGDPGRLVRPDGHRLRQARSSLRAGTRRARHGHLGLDRNGPWRTAASRRWEWTTAIRPIEGADVWFCSDEHMVFVARGAGARRRPNPRSPGPRRSRPSPTTSTSTSSTGTKCSIVGRSTCAAGEGTEACRAARPGSAAAPR